MQIDMGGGSEGVQLYTILITSVYKLLVSSGLSQVFCSSAGQDLLNRSSVSLRKGCGDPPPSHLCGT